MLNPGYEAATISDFRVHKACNLYIKKCSSLSHFCCKNVPPWQSHPKCGRGWEFIKADILTIRLTAPISWEISAAPLLCLCSTFKPPSDVHPPSQMAFSVITWFLSSYHVHCSAEGGITQTTPFTSYQIEPILAPHQLSLHLHAHIRRVSGGLEADVSTTPRKFNWSILLSLLSLVMCMCAFFQCPLLPNPAGRAQHGDRAQSVFGQSEICTSGWRQV